MKDYEIKLKNHYRKVDKVKDALSRKKLHGAKLVMLYYNFL